MPVCMCFKRERDREEGATLEGDSCGSHSGPPEAWSSEKSRLTEEERDGGVVVYLDMLYSVFNARITIKMLWLISYVYKTV